MRDKQISLKAKGLLALIMSLPNDWDFSINGIAQIIKEGKTAIYSALDELKSFGYCQVETKRNSKGVIEGTDYTFYEKPQSDYPYSENRDMDNQPQINKEETNTIKNSVEKELLKNEQIKEEKKLDKSNSQKKLKKFDFSFMQSDFIPIVEEWLQYKREIKDAYTAQRGVTAFYNKLYRLSGGEIATAKEIIEQSMANQWKGVFPIVGHPKQSNSNLPYGMILKGDRDNVIIESKEDLW